MIKKTAGIVLLVSFMASPGTGWAGGAVARRRAGQEAVIRRQQELAIQQQILQQRGALQQRAAQQVMQQQGQQVAEYIATRQYLQKKMTVEAAQAAAAQAARQAAGQVAVQQYYQTQGVQAAAQYTADQMAQQLAEQIAVQQAADAVQVKEIAPFEDVLASLDRSSRAWPLIIDNPAKEMLLAHMIQRYRKDGIMIQKPPAYYASMIDGMTGEAPEMLDKPLPQLLQVAAIIEYDFDNGQDKDELARRLLGPQGFEQNRQRLQASGL